VAPEVAPDVSRSDLMKPVVPLWVTLDQLFSFDKTSTDVPNGNVLIMLAVVEALLRRLTLPIVLSVPIISPDGGVVSPVPGEPDEPPDGLEVVFVNLRKSDLIKPVLPPTVTFDQPAGSCSLTSTLVLALTTDIELALVDADERRCTPAVVRNEPSEPVGSLRKSDLMKPVVLPTVTFDQPAGSRSCTSTLVFALTTISELAVVDADERRCTPAVVRKDPDASAVCDMPSIRHIIITRIVVFVILLFTVFLLPCCPYVSWNIFVLWHCGHLSVELS